jgi:hypothetical protein
MGKHFQLISLIHTELPQINKKTNSQRWGGECKGNGVSIHRKGRIRILKHSKSCFNLTYNKTSAN